VSGGGVRGRFAPSPTGPLHFGSLVAALASYCDARAQGGEWLVRIEDVDEPRSRPDAERAILAALTRYGMRWDGEVVRQSSRTRHYEDAVERLRAASLVYACACTRREMELAPVNAIGERVYPGTCRKGIDEKRNGHTAQRVRVGDAIVSYVDQLQGPQRQDLAVDVGDFIVRRADGLFAYQLAVVVDDALQGVTSIVRGADLLASTPRQIYLQDCLGFATPEYLHVPIAINDAGEKLSKQTGAQALPADPVPTLLAAWRFLAQPKPDARPASVEAFMSHAIGAWSRARLPPVRMLPAPRV
jgi:glutamyl-Q tRNA(Asp) synthetase